MAIAGRALARLVRSPCADEAFLCGLLSRLGQLAMVQALPRDYARVIEHAGSGAPTAAAERLVLGYDLHQVGAGLLRSWQLPELICRAVRCWGDLGQLSEADDEPVRQLAVLGHVADRVTAVLFDEDKGVALRELHVMGASLLGIAEDEIDVMIVSLEAGIAELAGMLEVAVEDLSHQAIVDQARNEMMQLSLGAALDLQQAASRAEELERRNRQLEDQVYTDKLTGIPNRAYFDCMLERVIDARLTGRSDMALGLLMIDIDHFKKCNDSHGHQVGDEVLISVAKCLCQSVRATDIVARYGGEEFVVLVPNTASGDLRGIAERVRQRIGAVEIDHGGRSLSVTVSIGGACVEHIRARSDGAALLSRADQHLYEAKNGGRNRSICRQIRIPGLAGP